MNTCELCNNTKHLQLVPRGKKSAEGVSYIDCPRCTPAADSKRSSKVATLIPSDKKSLLCTVDALYKDIEANKINGLLFVALRIDKTVDYCIRSHGGGITNIEALGLLEYLRIQFIEDYLERTR